MCVSLLCLTKYYSSFHACIELTSFPHPSLLTAGFVASTVHSASFTSLPLATVPYVTEGLLTSPEVLRKSAALCIQLCPGIYYFNLSMDRLSKKLGSEVKHLSMELYL